MASHLAPWIIVIGRLGQATKGVVYLSLSMLAAQAVWAGGGKTGGSRGAISAIAEQPFGRVLLFIVAGGLACYVLWRLVDAFGPDGRETDAKGLALRARSFAIALIYSGLTAAAVRTLMGNSSGKGGGDSAAQDWTARVLAQPFGSTLVVIAGAAVILGGLYKGWRAYAGKFEKKLDLSDLSQAAQKWLLRVCFFGLSARSFIFLLVGIFLMQAGLQSNAAKARGLSGALQAVQEQPYGRWLFAIVAAGLAAYGLYSLIKARWGRWDSA